MEKNFWQNLLKKMLEKPFLVIGIALLLTLFFGYITATRLKIDNDVTKMIPENNPVRLFLEKTHEIFGDSSAIAIAIENKNGIFNNQQSIEKIKQLTEKLEKIDNQITYENLKKELIDWQDSEIIEIQTFLNEKITELKENPEEKLSSLLQQTNVLEEYFMDPQTAEKAKKLSQNKKKLKKIYSFFGTPVDDKGIYYRRIKDIKSLTKIDYVFSEFSTTEKIEQFFKPFKINLASAIALSSYLSEKGINSPIELKNYLKEKLPHQAIYFQINPQEIQLLQSFNDTLLQQWSHLLKNTPKQIKVTRLTDLEKIKQNPSLELFLLQERLASWDMYQDFIYSHINPHMTMIMIEMVPKINFENRDILIHYVEKVTQEILQDTDFQYYIAGEPVVTKLLGQDMSEDMSFLSPIVIIVIGLFLFFSFKHWRGVAFPLITVIISVIWIMGTIALLGFSITILMSSLPVILMAVGSAYGIHVLHHYYESWAHLPNKTEGLLQNMREIGFAVVMAGLTTIAGFISMAPTDVLPLRDFGIFTGAGTVYALLIAVFLIPVFIKIGKNPPQLIQHSQEQKIDKIALLLEKFAYYTIHHKIRIIILFIILIIVSIFGISLLKIDMNTIEYFKETSPIRIADRVIVKNFAGTSNLDVIIDTGKTNGVADFEFLQQVDDFQSKIESQFGNPNDLHRLVGKVNSITLLVKKMNQTMNYGQKEFYKIPDTIFDDQGNIVKIEDNNLKKEKLAAVILNYIDKFDKNDTRMLIDSERRKIKISFILKSSSTVACENLSKTIIELSKKYFSKNASVDYTGNNTIANELNNLLVKGQIIGVITSILLVFLLVSWMQKSWIMGLISIIPLMIAVTINFGIMGLVGIRIEVGTAIIANISVGIGVDYVIHYLNGYILYRNKGLEKEQATIETTGIIGEAILINAVSVAMGFLVLLFSNFVALMNSGWLLALAMLTTALGSLTLMPVILNWYKGYIPLLKKKNL